VSDALVKGDRVGTGLGGQGHVFINIFF